MAPGFQMAGPDAQQAVIQEVSERLEPYTTETGMLVPFKTHLVGAANQAEKGPCLS